MNRTQAERRVHPDDKTLLLINPRSRVGRDMFAVVKRQMEGALNLVDAQLVEGPDAFREVLRAGVDAGVVRFVVGGGDGTLSLAADTLAGTGTVLGVLPFGTGNTFATGLGLPHHVPSLVAMVARGRARRFDLGEVSQGEFSRRFINSVTLGVSERLVRLLTPEIKRRLKWGAWPSLMIKALAETPPFLVTLRFPGGSDRFLSRQLVIAKGRNLAGPIYATPTDFAHDGRLHVFSLGGPGWGSLLRVSGRLLIGRHIGDREAHYRAVPELELETSPPMAMDIDGDIAPAPTPAVFAVQRDAIWVIVPG